MPGEREEVGRLLLCECCFVQEARVLSDGFLLCSRCQQSNQGADPYEDRVD